MEMLRQQVTRSNLLLVVISMKMQLDRGLKNMIVHHGIPIINLKDIRCDYRHMFLKRDEVLIGDGVMDYTTYLKRVSALPVDTPCFCEHFQKPEQYHTSFQRLHQTAKEIGAAFQGRTVHA